MNAVQALGVRNGSASRLAVAAVPLFLLLLAVLHQLEEARGRRTVAVFFSEFSLDVRRPELRETAVVEGSADLAMQVAVRAATLDLSGRVRVGDASPEVREAWLRAVAALHLEEKAAGELALGAVAARPAWAFHGAALAELVLAGEARRGLAAEDATPWLLPLRMAAAWARHEKTIPKTWALSALTRWNLLTDGQREEASGVVRRAFEEEDFQARALPLAIDALGVGSALSLVPETSAALAVARRAMATRGTFEERVDLEERWVAAEKQARRHEMLQLRGLLERQRFERAAEVARAFLQKHPVETFDDEEGRAQALVLLSALGDGRSGAWSSDPRGSLVRWFVRAPQRGKPGRDLLRATNGLTGIPEGTKALVSLEAGDEYGWRKALAGADTLGSSEWTPFFTRLATRQLAEGEAADADGTLGKLSRFDLGKCDVLLARRAVARARERGAELAELNAAWPAAFPADLDVSRWPASGAGELRLCVDPERDGGAALALTVSAREPTLVWWGWDGGRVELLRIEAGADQELEFPLEGLAGERTFGMGRQLGPGVQLQRARIEPRPTAGGTAAQ